jgi:hypothetical protein
MKNKSCPTTRRKGGWGERRYSSYLFSTSTLDGGEWSASRPDRALPLGEGPPVPIVQEAGWAPELINVTFLLVFNIIRELGPKRPVTSTADLLFSV